MLTTMIPTGANLNTRGVVVDDAKDTEVYSVLNLCD